MSPRRITVASAFCSAFCAAAALASPPAQAQDWVEEATSAPAAAEARPEVEVPPTPEAEVEVPPTPAAEVEVPPTPEAEVEVPPTPAEDFDEAAQQLEDGRPTQPRVGGRWVLDDHVGTDEVPWDDFDPRGDFYPRGGLHWGLELRVGAVPTTTLSTQPRPRFELGGFVDLRYSSHSPWRMRFGVAVSAEPYQQTNLGGGAFVTSAVSALKVRVLPLSFDIGRNLGFRAGPEIGVQFAPGPRVTRALFYAGGTLQLVGRTDDGRLEIGAYASLVMTGVARLERANAGGIGSRPTEHFEIDPVLGVSGGYLF